MRTRSCTVGVAVGLLGLWLLPSSALAAPKKKKAAAAAEVEAEAPAESKDKSVDDLMQDSTPKKGKKPAASSAADDEKPSDEEEVGEPDAWERPPLEEEKPKPAPPPVVEEKRGDGRQIEIGLMPGYGLKAGEAPWSRSNPYNFGLGIHGGYELDSKIFLGGGFIYFLGTSEPATDAITRVTRDTSANYMLAFLELGYDFWFGNLLFRPSMWLGMGFAVVDPYLTSGGVHTVQDFMFAPGANLIYAMSSGFYLGVELRYAVVTADGVAGLNLFGNIGLRF